MRGKYLNRELWQLLAQDWEPDSPRGPAACCGAENCSRLKPKAKNVSCEAGGARSGSLSASPEVVHDDGCRKVNGLVTLFIFLTTPFSPAEVRCTNFKLRRKMERSLEPQGLCNSSLNL